MRQQKNTLIAQSPASPAADHVMTCRRVLLASAQPSCTVDLFRPSEFRSLMLLSCRNLHRGTAQSFALDSKALQWSQHVRVSTVAVAVRHTACFASRPQLRKSVWSCFMRQLMCLWALHAALHERCAYHPRLQDSASAAQNRHCAQPAASQFTRAGWHVC
jgi:hypothetical protein